MVVGLSARFCWARHGANKHTGAPSTRQQRGCVALVILSTTIITMGMSTTGQDDVTRRMEALIDLLKAVGTDDNIHLQKETERCKRVIDEDIELFDNEEEGQWDEDLVSLTQQLQECIQETPEKLELEETQPARVTYKPSSELRRSRRPPRPDKEEKRKSKSIPQAPEEPEVDRREQLQREFSEMSYPKIGT